MNGREIVAGNIYKINVDLKLKQTYVIPKFVQYDQARLEFQLFDGGKVFDLTGYTVVEVAHVKANGESVVGHGAIDIDEKGKSIISYDYLGGEMSVIGYIETTFSIINADGKKVSIQPFKVLIVEDLRDGIIDEANPEWGLLQTYQAELLSMTEEVVLATDEAIIQAEYAKSQGNSIQAIADDWKFAEAYNATTQYKKNNVVSFSGSSFIAKQDVKGIAPPTHPTISNAHWGMGGRKGADGTGTVVRHRDEFIATANQKVFNLSNPYDQFQNRIDVVIGGVPQKSPENFTESSSTSITTIEGVPIGVSVTVTYFSEAVPLASDVQTTVNNHTGSLNNHAQRLTDSETKIAATTVALAETEQYAKQGIKSSPDSETIVSFMDDDGNPRLMNTILPLMESEGVVGNICVITNRFDRPDVHITRQQALELKAKGWSVVNHTHTHRNIRDGMTLEELDEDLKTSSGILKELNLDHDILVYPFGSHSPETIDIVRKYNILGISTSAGYNEMPLNSFAMHRQRGPAEPDTTLEQMKDAVDNAPKGSWVIFTTHTGYPGFEDMSSAVSDFRELIQHIKAKDIDIVSIREGIERKGNVIDVGGEKSFYRVGKNGEIRTTDMFEDYSYDNTTPVTYFPLGTSKTYLNYATATGKGFPTGLGGTVATVRQSSSRYNAEDSSHQTFQSYNSNELYRRRWNTSNKTWHAWEKIAEKIEGTPHNVRALANAFSASELISAYPTNSIITFRVTSAGATGYPFNQSGLATTYSIGGNGYSRQEYRVYNTPEVYTRYVGTDGVWTTWEQVGGMRVFNSLGYNANTLIGAFNPTRVTVFRVTSSDAVGTPNGIGGVFTTYKAGGNGFDYQTFKEYDSDGFYMRNVKVNGAWGAWVSLNSKGVTSSGDWVGTITMSSTNFLPLGDIKPAKFVDLNSVVSDGAEVVMVKRVWKVSELSKDQSTPTKIATVGAVDMLAYVDNEGLLRVKNSTTGQNHPTHFRLYYM